MWSGHVVVALNGYVRVSWCCHVKSCVLLCGNCSFAWLLMHSRPYRLTVHGAVQHHSAGRLLQRPESSGLRPQPRQKATTCQSEAPRWYVGGFWGATLFFICPPARTQLKNNSHLRWCLTLALQQVFCISYRGEKQPRPHPPLHLHSLSPYEYYLFMLIPS